MQVIKKKKEVGREREGNSLIKNMRKKKRGKWDFVRKDEKCEIRNERKETECHRQTKGNEKTKMKINEDE